MNRAFVVLLFIGMFLLPGCTIVHHLHPADKLGPDDGIVFGGFNIRFKGRNSGYYDRVYLKIYHADSGPEAGGKPVRVFQVFRSERIGGLTLKPGRYRIAKYSYMGQSGLVLSNARSFTVRAGRSNYIGTIQLVMNVQTKAHTLQYSNGHKARKQARKEYRRRFPDFADRYPVRVAFIPPEKGVKEDDPVLEQGRW